MKNIAIFTALHLTAFIVVMALLAHHEGRKAVNECPRCCKAHAEIDSPES